MRTLKEISSGPLDPEAVPTEIWSALLASRKQMGCKYPYTSEPAPMAAQHPTGMVRAGTATLYEEFAPLTRAQRQRRLGDRHSPITERTRVGWPVSTLDT